MTAPAAPGPAPEVAPDPGPAAGSSPAQRAVGRPRLGFLGPAGTFSEQALRSLPVAAAAELVPCPDVVSALDAVRRGRLTAALVPFENSVEGAVTTTLDELADPGAAALHIVAEATVAVRLQLLGRPGTTLDAVRSVATHPHAAAQTRRWLSAHLPGVAVAVAPSTATAAALVAGAAVPPDGTAPPDAAIAAPAAAAAYGLTVLADDIGDVAAAVTRFVLVAPPGPPPPRTGADRTTVVLYEREDHPGALLAMLTEFAVRGVNLTRLESRPTGAGLGRYCFSVDADGHVDDARMGEALSALHRLCAEVRYLGSYPAAGGPPAAGPTRPGTGDADFAAAAGWLAALRAGGAAGS